MDTLYEHFMLEIAQSGVFLPLVGYDKQGRSVFLVRFGSIQTNNMMVDDIYKVTIMLLSLALEANMQAAVKV